MKTKALVSVITVNYNQPEMTRELITSLHKQTYRHLEIIVVENGSPTRAVNPYEASFQNVRIICSSRNLGFAGGNNLGIAQAKGDYLFFINNDTVLQAQAIEKLLEVFEQSPQTGAVSPKIMYYDAPELIQYAGFTPICRYTGRNQLIGAMEEDRGQHDKARTTAFAHGAAMMISRRVLNKVGPMPESFFLYYEEMDWCEQIRRQGFQIMYEPGAVIYHKESLAVGQDSPLKTYYMSRNRLLFMRRNVRGRHLLIFLVFYLTVASTKFLLSRIFNGQWKHVKAYCKGLFWHVRLAKHHMK